MVACATGNEDESSASSNVGHVRLQATQGHFTSFKVHSSSHRVEDTLRLLEDFFLHKRTKASCRKYIVHVKAFSQGWHQYGRESPNSNNRNRGGGANPYSKCSVNLHPSCFNGFAIKSIGSCSSSLF